MRPAQVAQARPAGQRKASKKLALTEMITDRGDITIFLASTIEALA